MIVHLFFQNTLDHLLPLALTENDHRRIMPLHGNGTAQIHRHHYILSAIHQLRDIFPLCAISVTRIPGRLDKCIPATDKFFFRDRSMDTVRYTFCRIGSRYRESAGLTQLPCDLIFPGTARSHQCHDTGRSWLHPVLDHGRFDLIQQLKKFFIVMDCQQSCQLPVPWAAHQHRKPCTAF